MTEEDALRAAIAADPDEDTPRLAYADWLDENRPDPLPSPAANVSARAEFIRVQCRLAADAYDDPDYAILIERELDLNMWLNTHAPFAETPFPESDLESLLCPHTTVDELDPDNPTGSDWRSNRRGFAESLCFEAYLDTPQETLEKLIEALAYNFGRRVARTLFLEEAFGEEVALLVRHPICAKLRGLCIDDLSDSGEDEAVAAIAGSRHLRGLRRLFLNLSLTDRDCAILARSPYLGNLESLTITYPILARSIKSFARSKWFRKLRRLHLWLSSDNGLRELAELPAMPRLRALKLNGVESSIAAMKRFSASRSFPALAHLELSETSLGAEHIAALARGTWPLRHLRLNGTEVRKSGIEALIAAPFAPGLQVLELSWCAITAGGIQDLAAAESLAGLRRLNLEGNPIGPGGLAALAENTVLRSLRGLNLRHTDTLRGPIAGSDVSRFLSRLDLPDLRHLSLSKLPVGSRGARLLATVPTFANLTRLELEGCRLGEAGTKHLVESKNLSHLIFLDLRGNKTGSGAGKLRHAAVLPKLAYCALGTGIPRAMAARLRRRIVIKLPV